MARGVCSQRVGNFALRARNVNNCRDTDCTGGTADGTVARDCVHHRLPQRKSSGSSWSRRVIDFKRCWYKGAAGLSKDKLRRSGQQKQRRARMTLGANAYSTSIKGAVTVGALKSLPASAMLDAAEQLRRSMLRGGNSVKGLPVPHSAIGSTIRNIADPTHLPRFVWVNIIF
jgi:hypothetical protein